MSRTHLLGISSDSKTQDRLNGIAEEFKFNFAFFKSSDEFNEQSDSYSDVVVSVLSAIDIENSADVAGHVQVIKYACRDSYVVVVVNKKITPENIAFIKKSGADLIIHDTDVYESSFLEYVLSQLIRGSLIPMKGHDFKADTEIDFKVLTMLPLNKKIVPVVFPNDKLVPAKSEKIKNAKELYVGRDDIQKVQEYIKNNQDLTADGIVSRCRVNYMNLCKAHSDLVISLFDKSDRVTFSLGKQLLDKCTSIASEMLMNLSTLTDPWSIINNSTIGETGSVERSPAIAAMAGLMTINLKDVNTEDTILAGLISDIGMITLHPDILKKIRHNKMDELSQEELSKYYNHPLLSVDKCLEKKLPLNEKIKGIVMATHERFDRLGFPNKLNPVLISKESQLLQYCEFIDQKLLIKMGEKSEKSGKVQMDILQAELMNKKILDVSVAFELKKYLSIIDTTKKLN